MRERLHAAQEEVAAQCGTGKEAKVESERKAIEIEILIRFNALESELILDAPKIALVGVPKARRPTVVRVCMCVCMCACK
jgi:hypothetical protein